MALKNKSLGHPMIVKTSLKDATVFKINTSLNKKIVAMRNFNVILAFGLAFILLLPSCEIDSDIIFGEPAFKLEFISGAVITENDLLYYDASSHLFHLKRELDRNSLSDFSVIIYGDTIYQGKIVSSFSSAFPNYPYYISDGFFQGADLIMIGTTVGSGDLRNDKRILDLLRSRNKLRMGLSCWFQNITVTHFCEHRSTVNWEITIKNNDEVDYYILDPQKMGEEDFLTYTSGYPLFVGSPAIKIWTGNNPDYYNVDIGSFSILPKNEKVTYSFSVDYHKIETGNYKVLSRFQGLRDREKLNIRQKNGDIWVGTLIFEYYNIAVK